MQHPETDTGSPSPYWDKENPFVFMHVPLESRTAVSHNLGIPASEGSSVSCVQADGNRNVSSTLSC